MRGYPAVLFVSSDGGLIKFHSGYVKPHQFAPVMEDAIKKEAEFQAKLAKYMKMPDDAIVSREIAILYLKRQSIEKALPISAKMPNDVELNREFGRYYLGQSDIENALIISAKMPNDVELNREFGFYYLSNKEFDKALEISAKMPDDIKLNNQFATTYLGQGQIEDAIPFSDKVFGKDPKNTSGLLPNLHIRFGIAYGNKISNQPEEVAAKNTNMAVTHFSKVINEYPKSNVYEHAQLYLGVTYSLAKQYDKSIEILEKLISHTTTDSMKQGAETRLKQIKELAAQATNGSDN